MGAYYDKYDPKSGGFRAPLDVDTTKTSAGNPLGVGLDTDGNVVVGAGTTGVVGVLVLTMDKLAGEIVDVMTDGECVGISGTIANPGTIITADTTTGVLGVTAPDATHTRVGFVPADSERLIVRART